MPASDSAAVAESAGGRASLTSITDRFRSASIDWSGHTALVAILAVGLLLRLFHLGHASLWYDELFTRFYMNTGLHFMWTEGFWTETNPPLYYSLLLAWVNLFGTSEAAIRMLSVLVSVATIPMVAALGRELGGRSCGLVAALIFALAPMEIFYAQEARAYAFMLPPLAMALWGLARILRTPGAWGGWFSYILGAALAVYVHTTAVFVVAACGLAGSAALLIQSNGRPWSLLCRWVGVNAIVVALCAPEALAMIEQVHANRFSWMLPTTLWDVRASVATLVTGPAMSPPLLQLAAAVPLLLALMGALLAFRPSLRFVSVVVLVPAVDFTLILAATFHQPILVPRLLCWMWLPLSVALAYVIIEARRARLVLIGITTAVLGSGLAFQLGQDRSAKEPWEAFLTHIQPELAKAEWVVVGPWTQPMALAYYGADMSKTVHWSENQPATIENTTIRQMLDVPDVSREAVQAAIRAGRGVVLIQRSVEFRFRQLLDVPPPSSVVAERCWGAGDCLTASYWQPRPDISSTSASLAQ